MGNQRKQITFDLDTEAMKKYYPKAGWRNGYADIKKQMLDYSFEWMQGSAYVSTRGLNNMETLAIIKKLTDENKWLNKCMRDCRVTNVGKSHDMNHLFDKNTKVLTRLEIMQAETKETQVMESVDELDFEI